MADINGLTENAVKDGGVTEAEILLMQQIVRQDRKAFERFYYDYSPRIGKFLFRMLKNQELVDEAINNVMLTVWQSADRFDPSRSKLTTWLFGIAHNKALKLLEQQRRHQHEELPDTEQADDVDNPSDWVQTAPDNPERTVMGWELGDNLLRALDLLSAEQRMVLELTFVEGYSYQEIADITDCPVNTVKTRVFHARKKLAELLAKRGYVFNSSLESWI